jgi:hypothetical protein
MTVTTIVELETLLPNVAQQYYRLVLLVGPIGSGKTPLLKGLCGRQGIPYCTINLALSQRLLALTGKERPLRVRRLLAEILDEQSSAVIVLDNIELLFDPALRQDPLACLQSLSRNRTLVVAWGGAWSGHVLTYAEPGHPEYRRYERPEALVMTMG